MRGFVDGKSLAREIEDELSEIQQSAKLEIILVGEDEASTTFVNEKLEAAERTGFETSVNRFDSEADGEEVLELIQDLNGREEVDGVLIQLPLPNHINENRIFRELSVEKDVDGLTPENLGKTLRGDESIRPAAVEGVMKIIEHEEVDPVNTRSVIVNNSSLIGKPLAVTLSNQGATVTVCNRNSSIEDEIEDADIVVTATGKHGVIDSEMIPDDSLVIDAGYAHGEGDLENYEAIAEKAKVSPVPDGLGPLTVAYTLKNLLKLKNQG